MFFNFQPPKVKMIPTPTCGSKVGFHSTMYGSRRVTDPSTSAQEKSTDNLYINTKNYLHHANHFDWNDSHLAITTSPLQLPL